MNWTVIHCEVIRWMKHNSIQGQISPYNNIIIYIVLSFLAVQDSSIGDLVSQSVSKRLLIFASLVTLQ